MIYIYGLVDPREPDHVRYIGAAESIDEENCLDLYGCNVMNKDRRWWIMNLKNEKIKPQIKILKKVKDNLYNHMKKLIYNYYTNGHELFNIKFWIMPIRKPNKLDEVRLKIQLKKLRNTFPAKNFIGNHDGNFWVVGCDDFDFYVNDKKFKVFRGILRKKLSFPVIFCYTSNAEPERRMKAEKEFNIKYI